MGVDFFKNLPARPGVYYMLGKQGEILYVGKAKNLKLRLASYGRAKQDQVSRKVMRLVHFIHEIQWEIAESERAALLRENQLLRLHRPPYNVQNTTPESYCFIHLKRTGRQVSLKMSTQMEPDYEFTYGAFKGRRSVQDGFRSLLRLLWAAHAEVPMRFQFPAVLLREKFLPAYTLNLPEAMDERTVGRWMSGLKRFLKGTSQTLLTQLTEELLLKESIPPFMYAVVQEDLESANLLFERGPHRNQKIRRRCQIQNNWISQNELDDFLVILREKEKPKSV